MQIDDKLCLNIGAGKTYIPGFKNIDVSKKADIVMNLSVDQLPFADSSVDLVVTSHTLEHIDDYLFALGEIHRVLKHGAKLLVGVPYVTLTEFNLVNPYHKHHFNEFSFDFFDPDRLLNSAAEEGQILFKKVCHRFHYLPEFAKKSAKKKDWARRHYFNVVREIIFGVLAIKETESPLAITPQLGDELLREYDSCMAARIPYSRRV